MPRMSRDEFHRWTNGRKGRFERFADEPVTMLPERIQHVRLKVRMWAALDRAICDGGLDCEALGDGVTIEVDSDTDHEPDAIVNFGPAIHPDATVASNPIMVGEVLSPGLQSIDTTDKRADYFGVPSIEHYLIIRARRQEIIHHRRQGGALQSRTVNIGSIRLDPPALSFDLADVDRA